LDTLHLVTSDPIQRFRLQRGNRLPGGLLLRPMTGPETLDSAVGAYQALAKRILKLTAVPSLLCTAAVAFVFSHVLPALGVTKSPDDTATQVVEALTSIGVGLVVALPLFLIGISYSSGLVTMLVSDYATGNVPNAAAAQAATRRGLPKIFGVTAKQIILALLLALVGAGLLMGAALLDTTTQGEAFAALVAGAGVLALTAEFLVLPWVMAVYALAIPVSLLEGAGVRQSAKRSGQLLRGSDRHEGAYFTVIGVQIVIFLLVLFIWAGVSGGLDLFGAREWLDRVMSGWMLHDPLLLAYDVLPWFLSIWFVIPFWGTATTIIYYERRTRLEGYDIDLLAQEVWRSEAKSRFQL
jgi:hypothetical protein